MAIVNYRGVFPVLNNSTRITMALPEVDPVGCEKWRVLWLLGEEGMTSDRYVRKFDVEAISRKFNIAIVMPEGLHSDYENMVRGLRWYDFVSDALPKYFYENFPISDRKEDNFVFGFGMGGLGAFRLALRNPDMAEVFGCCMTNFDVFVKDRAHRTPEHIQKLKTIYGDDYRSESVLDASDPYRMIKSAERMGKLMVFGEDPAAEKIREMQAKRPEGAYVPHSLELFEYDTVLNYFLDFATSQGQIREMLGTVKTD